jgi:hypothetical protein
MADQNADLFMLSSKRQEAKRSLIRAALGCVLEEFNDDPADPGWQAELNDEQFDAAAHHYHQADNEFSNAKERAGGS